MKLLAFLLLCFLPGNQKGKVLSESAADKVIRVEIRTLNAIIQTEYSISCPQFDRQFQDHIITKTIEDRAKIEAFLDIINSAKAISDHRHEHIDVRGKIIISYESGKKDIICTNYSATSFTINEQFFEMEGQALFGFMYAQF